MHLAARTPFCYTFWLALAPALVGASISRGGAAIVRDLDGNMPKLKTHKGIKKRFKVSATGKVSHKRCGSSHLMSHKNGKQVRRLRKKKQLSVEADAKRLRAAVHQHEGSSPVAVEIARQAAVAEEAGRSSD